jgi:hypothetical protein
MESDNKIDASLNARHARLAASQAAVLNPLICDSQATEHRSGDVAVGCAIGIWLVT